MPYSIAYNSGSTVPFGTYKQGNILMGLKPQEYTVSSGFTWYANATTPNDNYLIISDTYSQGWSTQQESKPTIWRSETGTTESFVSLVNQLPDVNGVTGFTDSGSAMKYLMDSGKYFVSKDDYLGIVTDDLIFNLDAGWYLSYSGSGTTWKNIKGSNIGTLTNGPTFTSADGGGIVFDGVDDYINFNNLFSGSADAWNGSPNATISMFVKMTSTGNIFTIENVFEVNTGPGTSIRFASNPWAWRNGTSGGVNLSDGKYHQIVYRHNSSTLVGEIFVDGNSTFTNAINSGLNASSGHLTLMGRYGGTTSNAGGTVGTFQIYNRALSNEEILQNYNAQKGRFGL